MSAHAVRDSRPDELPAVLALYRAVAAQEGGLARTAEEITDDYVAGFLAKAAASGLSLVAVAESGALAGEIHCYALGPRVFAHVLGELTIAVAPEFQGQGVGRLLFSTLLHRIEHERPEIRRVELIARESNQRAVAFYESLGFMPEGRLVGRIQSVGGGYEADIPMAWHREGTQ